MTIDLARPLKPFPKGAWANYPAGVIAGFLARGMNPGGFDALIHSTVPLGGGLSSSAALEVATATLLEVITGRNLDPVEKALLCQKAEHEYAGVPCGIMDQFISVMGREDHLLLLDCRSRKTELVPMSDPSVALLIINTNVKHELAGGEYAKRRDQCEAAAKILGVTSLRDATADTLEARQGQNGRRGFPPGAPCHRRNRTHRSCGAKVVRASNWPTVGQLMYASHCSLRDDYEVSCKELDAVVEIAEGIGIQGRGLRLPHDRRRIWRLRGGAGENRMPSRPSPKKSPPIQKENRNRGDDFCFASGGGRDGHRSLKLFRRGKRCEKN